MSPYPNPFKLGQSVRRAKWTLGANGDVGKVVDIVMKGDHECLTVVFGERRETFAWGAYELATPSNEGASAHTSTSPQNDGDAT